MDITEKERILNTVKEVYKNEKYTILNNNDDK